jgi:hypothetical protein
VSKEPGCGQSNDKHDHDDEDLVRRSKTDAEFTVGKTMQDVDQQVTGLLRRRRVRGWGSLTRARETGDASCWQSRGDKVKPETE